MKFQKRFIDHNAKLEPIVLKLSNTIILAHEMSKTSTQHSALMCLTMYIYEGSLNSHSFDTNLL